MTFRFLDHFPFGALFVGELSLRVDSHHLPPSTTHMPGDLPEFVKLHFVITWGMHGLRAPDAALRSSSRDSSVAYGGLHGLFRRFN